ncbi:HypC/HybG/HupF family hydrogenase formation chaperone [Mesorhizobium sp. PL10]
MGVPYEIVEAGFLSARARSRHEETIIDMSLVGDQPPGTHVLVFLGAAREVISADLARQIGDALEAVRLVMSGQTEIDHLFADLSSREPTLPEHLRTQEPASLDKRMTSSVLTAS